MMTSQSQPQSQPQVMAQPDEMMHLLFVNNTHLELTEIDALLASAPPMEAKLRLAFEITAILKGENLAQAARQNFNRIVRAKETPQQVPEFLSPTPRLSLVEALVFTELCKSKSEARRLLEQGAIRVQSEVTNEDLMLGSNTAKEILLQRGKRGFAKLKLIQRQNVLKNA